MTQKGVSKRRKGEEEGKERKKEDKEKKEIKRQEGIESSFGSSQERLLSRG